MNDLASFEQDPLGKANTQFADTLVRLCSVITDMQSKTSDAFVNPVETFLKTHVAAAYQCKSKYDKARIAYDANPTVQSSKKQEVRWPNNRERETAENLERQLIAAEEETLQKLREVDMRKQFDLLNSCCNYMQSQIELFRQGLAILEEAMPAVEAARKQAQEKQQEFDKYGTGSLPASPAFASAKPALVRTFSQRTNSGSSSSTAGSLSSSASATSLTSSSSSGGGYSAPLPVPPTKSAPVNPETQVFGAPLSVVLDRSDPRATIPPFVDATIQYLTRYGMEEEGIFRVSPNVADVAAIKAKIDTGKPYNLDEEVMDVHIVAALLKQYFRDLPESIIPAKTHQHLLAIKSAERNKDLSIKFLRGLLLSLPEDNVYLLHSLFHFLYQVQQHQQTNKMNATNLATVFGPNLLRDSNPFNMDAGAAIMLVKRIIEDCPSIFLDDYSGVEYTYEMVACYDYVAQSAEELSFKTGNVLLIFLTVDDEWAYAVLDGQVGMVPFSYLSQ
jgi:hypothetical protein